MNICLFCKLETTNKKFCSRPCAASYNNKLYPKRIKSNRICACGALIKNEKKVCNTCYNLAIRENWCIELKPLVDSGKSSRRIANILGISQTALLHRLKKCNLNLKNNIITEHTCHYCNASIIDKSSNFCSQEHKNLYYKNTDYYKERYEKGKDIRSTLLTQFNNVCSLCGYNKNSAALVFHHIDPKDKKFSISVKSCVYKSTTELQEEVNKCILVCANCHAELHYPLHSI